jgi:flavin reductase (DIM6/NTAB) family NADH-FMN oxidoreductase RutF
VAVVVTLDADGPHAVPVSALHRRGPDGLLLALARSRGTLARLRTRPQVALSLLGAGLALAVRGRARVVADPLPGAEFMAAVLVSATEVRDTAGARTLVHEGVRWSFTDEEAGERHERVLAALRETAAGVSGT